MRNTLADLNNHLFEQIERLNDEDLSDQELEKEVTRAKAIEGLASVVISNARLALDGQRFVQDYGYRENGPKLPEKLDLVDDKTSDR